MKKLLSLILSLVLLSPLATSVTAYEQGDPCLLYGYDPNESDIYETYGDRYFLDKCPVKTPSGQLFITLNNKTVRNMIEASENDDSLAHILTNDYFPELDIKSIYCTMLRSELYEMNKESYFEYSELNLNVTVILKDNSKENVTRSLIALAPRADVDIVSVLHQSYDLLDVSSTLKYIAGWSENDYRNLLCDINRDGYINLEDVSGMLKVIAGWDIETILCIEN